jgi:hypothetical protein
MHEVEMTIADLLKLGVRLGLIAEGESGGDEAMVNLVDDNKRTHIETKKRLRGILPGNAKITLTPKGWFDHGDPGPLVDLLRKGEVDLEVQTWIADMIEQGGFASRKTRIERVEDLGPLGDAIRDFSYVRELLRERGPRRGARIRAMRVVSLRHRVPLVEIEQYLKRGAKDRHRIVKVIPEPFKKF